jgi:hypothetical protein
MRNPAKIGVLVIALALAGCTTSPILNVSDATVTAPAGKALSKDQVRQAIMRAGAGLGWQITDEGPNMLVGTIHLRDHKAVVEIPYSTASYSLRYRSSVNLYEKDGKIHKNYNGWIQNLQKGINTQLSLS